MSFDNKTRFRTLWKLETKEWKPCSSRRYIQEQDHSPWKYLTDRIGLVNVPQARIRPSASLSLVNALEFMSLGEANSTLPNSEGIEESARMWDTKFRMRTGPVTGTRTLSHVAWAAFSLLVGRWAQEFKWHSEALLMRWRLLMWLRRHFRFTSEMVQSRTGELSATEPGPAALFPEALLPTHASLTLQLYWAAQLPKVTLFSLDASVPSTTHIHVLLWPVSGFISLR